MTRTKMRKVLKEQVDAYVDQVFEGEDVKVIKETGPEERIRDFALYLNVVFGKTWK